MNKRVDVKYYKNYLVILLAAIMLCILSGCSLAVEGAGVEGGEGQARLIGVYITKDIVNMHENDETITDIESSGKVYATVNKNNSEKPSDWEVDFEGLEGYAFYHATFQVAEEPFSMIIGGDGVCDVHQHLKVSDDGEAVELSGTLYALLEKEQEHIFYANPVYQTEDGDIFLRQGDGVHMSSLGALMTITLEEEITLEEAGEKESYSGSVEISYEVLNSAPSGIRFQFMNEKLEVLHTQVYMASAVPEELKVVEGTACLIVETLWADGTVTRELVEKGNDERVSVETFYRVDEIVLAKKGTTIIWK